MTGKDEAKDEGATSRDPKPPIGKWIGIGIGAGIGSAAIAAALLYASGAPRKQSGKST